WRRPSGVWFCRRVHPLRAWGRGLSFANSLCAARAYAGANTFDVRARAAATLYGVLGLFGEFRIAAANIAVRHDQYRWRADAGSATGRRPNRHRADRQPTPDAHSDRGRKPAIGGG